MDTNAGGSEKSQRLKSEQHSVVTYTVFSRTLLSDLLVQQIKKRSPQGVVHLSISSVCPFLWINLYLYTRSIWAETKCTHCVWMKPVWSQTWSLEPGHIYAFRNIDLAPNMTVICRKHKIIIYFWKHVAILSLSQKHHWTHSNTGETCQKHSRACLLDLKASTQIQNLPKMKQTTTLLQKHWNDFSFLACGLSGTIHTFCLVIHFPQLHLMFLHRHALILTHIYRNVTLAPCTTHLLYCI